MAPSTLLSTPKSKSAINSSVGFGSEEINKKAEEYIEEAKKRGESLGGVVETIYKNVPKL